MLETVRQQQQGMGYAGEKEPNMHQLDGEDDLHE
jgi:hypothetical protein